MSNLTTEKEVEQPQCRRCKDGQECECPCHLYAGECPLCGDKCCKGECS